ncbi:MAG: type II toxin-antitoxin system VapB family antitoxin [Ignavibacteriales bacterium]
MNAPIQIRKPQAVELIRKVAARRGQSITDAVEALARAELERQDAAREAEVQRKLAAVREIVERFKALPKTGEMLTDEDLYGPDGLPR